jgi:hypothetical protein
MDHKKKTLFHLCKTLETVRLCDNASILDPLLILWELMLLPWHAKSTRNGHAVGDIFSSDEVPSNENCPEGYPKAWEQADSLTTSSAVATPNRKQLPLRHGSDDNGSRCLLVNSKRLV